MNYSQLIEQLSECRSLKCKWVIECIPCNDSWTEKLFQKPIKSYACYDTKLEEENNE